MFKKGLKRNLYFRNNTYDKSIVLFFHDNKNHTEVKFKLKLSTVQKWDNTKKP